MLKKIPVVLITLFLVACQSQSAPTPTLPPSLAEALTEKPTGTPLPTATLVPTEAPLPTPTLLPTETALPDPTATIADLNIFGVINAEDAPAGFMLEPIAKVIFEAEMQKRMDTGEIGAFQVEGLSIVPRGDGTFFAEIFYALQADASFWPEDFGSPGDDGWVRGKCTRFDFEITEDAYFLKKKAVCN